MSPVADRRIRRYRRRIVAWGAAMVFLVAAVGALVTLPRVERDLERRVEDALAEAGHVGWSVSFSGQDGTLECVGDAGGTTDPTQAVEVAESVRGVRGVRLGDGCVADAAGDAAATATSTTVVPATTASPDDVATTVPELTVPPTTEPADVDTAVDVIADTPSLSQFEALIEFAGLGEQLAADGPLTVFAPTDDAFDALSEAIGPDSFAAVTTDVELVERLVLDHVVRGRIDTDAMADGALDTLGGDPLVVDLGPPLTFTSRDVTAGVDAEGDLDIDASNGVVHAINQVLLPPDLGLAAPPGEPVVFVRWAEGLLVVGGTVADPTQRDRLVAGLSQAVEPDNLVDQLSVDPAVAVTGDEIDRIAELGAALPGVLVEAELELVGGGLVVTGVAADDADAERASQLALDAAADAELSRPPQADDTAAAELAARVNALVSADPILFTVDSATLDASAAPVLDRVAALLRTLDGVGVTVVGHTDSSGDAGANLILSERRAAAVVEALVARDVRRAVLDAEGRGELEPRLDPVTGREDREASRRVEFVVVAS